MTIKSPIAIIKSVVATKRHAKMIAASQAKIGPYVPVSYTSIWS